MVKERGREGRVQGCGVLLKFFFCFTRLLYVDGVLENGRDGVMFLSALQRLRRYLFVYLVLGQLYTLPSLPFVYFVSATTWWFLPPQWVH